MLLHCVPNSYPTSLHTDGVLVVSIRRRVDNGIEVLGEEIVYKNGSFMRVKRWLRGVHPHLGTIVWGYTGWETLVEKDVIKPTHTFYVMENSQVA